MVGEADSDEEEPPAKREGRSSIRHQQPVLPSSGLHFKADSNTLQSPFADEPLDHGARLAPGTKLFGGRFELRRCVGTGGNGTVYEAFDRTLGELVALKILQNTDPESIYAIKEEFRALSDVVAPNLVGLHELFSDGSRWFFTMDLVRGAHFVDYVRRRGGARRASEGASDLDAEALRDLMRQLVCAVGAIHAADKLHRDLKPSNVMVNSEGRVVVLDFGLVCDPANEDTDRIVGTPVYMAPEQVSGLGTQRASDWYAVGVILFEALTGQVPFDGAGVHAIRHKLTKNAPSPRTLAPGVPSDLDALCSALLARDPSERPTYEKLRSALGLSPESRSLSIAPRSSEGAFFVGRTRELAELSHCFDSLAAGRPVVVLVDGASGVGKSTLVRRFVESCVSKLPKRIFSGRCFEHESVPYKGVDSLVDELGLHLGGLEEDQVEPLVESDTTELLRAFPVLRAVRAISGRARAALIPDPQEARHRAFRSLKELIRNFARTRAVVFFIDDLQWADLDSVRLLIELLSPPSPPSVMFVAAYRSERRGTGSPVHAFRMHAAAVRGDFTVRELSLAPLEPQESQELARSLSAASSAPAGLADAIVAEAGGNPLFIELLSRHGVTVPKAGETPSLDRTIVAQLDDEAASARRLMSLVAVAGEPIPQEIVLGALQGDATGRASLAALRVRRFVRTFQSAGVQFVEPYHDRIRESVSAALTEESRRQYHLQLATLLEAAGTLEPGILARQFHGAGDLARAHGYALRAAEVAASALAFVRAAAHFALAIETCSDPVSLPSLHRKRADALASSGHCAAAAAEYLLGAALVEGEAAVQFRTLAAAQSFTAGHIEEALRALRPLLAQAGVSYPESPVAVGVHLAASLARMRIRGVRFTLREASSVPLVRLRRIDAGRAASDGLASVDPIRAASLMLRTAAFALDSGEPGRIAWALSHYGLFLASTGLRKWAAESRVLLDRAETLASRSSSRDSGAVVRLCRAKLSLSLGNWATALAQADDCAAFTRRECVGGWGHVTVAHNIALFALQASGEIFTMGSRADEYLKEAMDTGDLYAEVTTRIYTGISRLFADDPTGARGRLDVAFLRWQSANDFTLQSWFALQALTQCDLYEGQPFAAWDRLNRAWPLLERSRLLGVSVVKPFALRLRASAAVACAIARPLQGRPFVQSAEKDAARLGAFGRADATGAFHAISGSLLAHKGQEEEAARRLELAAKAFSSAGMAIEAASARAVGGALRGDEEGQARKSSAADELRARGVANPKQWASRLIVPRREGEEKLETWLARN